MKRVWNWVKIRLNSRLRNRSTREDALISGMASLRDHMDRMDDLLKDHDGWVRLNLKQEIATQIVEMGVVKNMAVKMGQILEKVQERDTPSKRDPDTSQTPFQTPPDRNPDTTRGKPTERIDYTDQILQIRALLRRLSRRQRELVYLLTTCSEGYLDYAQIAVKLGISESRARDIVGEVLKKGVPIRRIDEFGRRLFRVPQEFEDVILGNLGQDRLREENADDFRQRSRRLLREPDTL